MVMTVVPRSVISQFPSAEIVDRVEVVAATSCFVRVRILGMIEKDRLIVFHNEKTAPLFNGREFASYGWGVG